MANLVAVVAGIPGVGKSEFCREYLQNKMGWLHLDIDWLGRSLPWPNDSLKDSWDTAIKTHDAGPLFNAFNFYGNVVVDWGFPVRCIPFVMGLANYGARILWFDGDVPTAREVFARRGNVSLAAFDRQMSDLRSIHVPAQEGAKVIRVLEEGPRFLPHEDIYRTAFK